jgi:hypothetical protein
MMRAKWGAREIREKCGTDPHSSLVEREKKRALRGERRFLNDQEVL